MEMTMRYLCDCPGAVNFWTLRAQKILEAMPWNDQHQDY